MMIFVILAPYAAFATLMLLTSSTVSLLASGAICLLVIALDAWRGRPLKTLSAGSAILFIAIGCYIPLADAGMSRSAVKLAVDLGILAISLTSLLIGRPFTQQYAIEMVDAETALSPGFKRANYVITGAWTLAFVLMAIGNVMMLYIPGLPFWVGLAIGLAARNSALYFTSWYRTRLSAPRMPLGLPAGS